MPEARVTFRQTASSPIPSWTLEGTTFSRLSRWSCSKKIQENTHTHIREQSQVKDLTNVRWYCQWNNSLFRWNAKTKIQDSEFRMCIITTSNPCTRANLQPRLLLPRIFSQVKWGRYGEAAAIPSSQSSHGQLHLLCGLGTTSKLLLTSVPHRRVCSGTKDQVVEHASGLFSCSVFSGRWWKVDNVFQQLASGCTLICIRSEFNNDEKTEYPANIFLR